MYLNCNCCLHHLEVLPILFVVFLIFFYYTIIYIMYIYIIIILCYFYIYSGGVDRTGVVVAMETALLKMEVVEPVDPLEIVRLMRDKRGMMLPAVVSVCMNVPQFPRGGVLF